MKDINDFLLDTNTSVGELRNWIYLKNDNSKQNITNLIYHRFYNRYIKHIANIDSGFLIMAISCLMIENLESFKQGKENTKEKGAGISMFKSFFESEADFFPEFNDLYFDFYSNIRCGILHQAETTNGWRILRKGELLDKTNKTINSKKFINSLEKSLLKYIDLLNSSDFETLIWKNAIVKLENICNNCESKIS